MVNSSNKKPGRNLSTIEKAAIDNTMGELLDLAGTEDETVEVIRDELEEQFSKRSVELGQDEAIELARRLFNLSIKAIFSLLKTECVENWDIEKRQFFEKNVPVEIEPIMQNWYLLEDQDRKRLVNSIYGGGLKQMRDIFIVAKAQVSKVYRGDESVKYVDHLMNALISLEIHEITDEEAVMDTMLSATRDFFGDIYKDLLDSVEYKKNNSARE